MIFKDIKLKEHQKKVVNFYLKSKRKGLIAFHTVGSGKTITAIATAKCLMSNDKNLKIIILTPVSVVIQFKNEVNRLIVDKTMLNQITVSTHKKWLNKYERNEVNAKKSFLIIDEVHKFKGSDAKYAKLLSNATKEASRILLLTATPVENDPTESRNYLAMINDISFKKQDKLFNLMIDQKSIKEELQKLKKLVIMFNLIDNPLKMKSQYNEIMGNIIDEILGKYDVTLGQLLDIDYNEEYYKCKFSYFTSIKDINDYPTVKEHIIQLKMPTKYQIQYEQVERNQISDELKEVFNIDDDVVPQLNVFLNGLRRAVNKLTIKSPKINWIITHIKSQIKQNKKVVIYSNWVKFGVKEISSELDNLNIKYGLIIGSISNKKRSDIIKQYNKNVIKVLLITSAGAEGIDLKETRSLVIMEPHWHYSRIQQVIGRAVRYKSHEKLNISDRTVDIYHILLVKNKHTDVKFVITKQIVETYNLFKKLFKKKKKKRRRNYIKEKKERKKQKLIDETIKIKPSIDIVLFNLSNDKRKIIDEFYNDINDLSIENQKC